MNGVVVLNTTSSEMGYGFNSRVRQIGRSVAKRSPPLRRLEQCGPVGWSEKKFGNR